MKIVLLGSIPKGDDKRNGWHDWKVDYIEIIRKVIPNAAFVHGDSISDSEGSEMVVGHDLYQIQEADVCVVDARKKIGAGTAQEIVFAKSIKKPVVIVIPKGSHHRKNKVVFHGHTVDDWIHPFLDVSSDFVADSIQEAADWIAEFQKSNHPVKDLSVFQEAIATYVQSRDKI